jgi:hypothetical protein
VIAGQKPSFIAGRGTTLLFVGGERFPAREPFLEPVPVLDRVLADLPAEQDLLALAERREIDKAGVEILHLDAQRFELVDAPLERRPVTLDLDLELGEVARGDPAAVSLDLSDKCRPASRRGKETPPVVDHALGDRPDVRERLVGFLGGEVAICHVALPVVTARADAQSRPGWRVPAVTFLWSRAAIWLFAVFAYLWFEPKPPPLQARWDWPELHDLGYGLDVWARWDSRWYVTIAEHGYGVARDTVPAFFPLYPTLVAALGRVVGGHYVLAGVAVSLGAAYGAFRLLHAVAAERLGEDGARRAVLYLALFPMSLFLQAVYAESLFLLLGLAAFALAERGRFGWAGAAAGLALLTRSAGFALLPALALLAWPSRAALARLLLAPALFAAYPVALWIWIDEPWAWLHAQESIWHRHLSPAGPLGGIWDALTRWHPSGVGTQHALAVNLEGWAFLLLFAGLTIVAWRRLGAPYGLFCALSLALPLSVPSERWPLLSLPRFGLTVFPFFLALATLGAHPRVHDAIVGLSAAFLGVAVVQWVLYQWVA